MRALELCGRLDEITKSLPVLHERYGSYQGLGQPIQALDCAEELLRRADALGNEKYQMIGHRVTSGAQWHIGELVPALEHTERTIALYEGGANIAIQGGISTDIKTTVLTIRAAVLWSMGYPERAAASLEEGISHTRALDQPLSLAFILGHACVFLHFIARAPERGRLVADNLLTLAEEFGVRNWAPIGEISRAHANLTDGNVVDGIAMMSDKLGTPEEPGYRLFWPAHAALLAEAYPPPAIANSLSPIWKRLGKLPMKPTIAGPNRRLGGLEVTCC